MDKLTEQIVRNEHSFGDGWEHFAERIENLNIDVILCESHGFLKIKTLNEITEQDYEIIREVEDSSRFVCERCGKNRKYLPSDKSWITRTLCRRCLRDEST